MVYKNGLYFDGDLDSNIITQIKRIEGNKASLIIVEGGVGEGKTTLMIHILDYINQYYKLPEVDLVEPHQLAMGGVEFLKKLRVCYDLKLPCIAYDEAGDFSKRGSLTSFNAMLNRTFDTFRAFKIIVLIGLPNFDVLDQDLFDKKIPRLMLNLRDRSDKYGNYDAYSLYRMSLLKAKMKKYELKNWAYSMIEPNFRGHFLDLSEERSKLLDRLSTKNKFSILRKSEVKIEGLMSYPELATKLFKSIDWCRRATSNLKIKPDRIIDRIKYFNVDTLNRLAEVSDINSERPDLRKGQDVRRKL